MLWKGSQNRKRTRDQQSTTGIAQRAVAVQYTGCARPRRRLSCHVVLCGWILCALLPIYADAMAITSSYENKTYLMSTMLSVTPLRFFFFGDDRRSEIIAVVQYEGSRHSDFEKGLSFLAPLWLGFRINFHFQDHDARISCFPVNLSLPSSLPLCCRHTQAVGAGGRLCGSPAGQQCACTCAPAAVLPLDGGHCMARFSPPLYAPLFMPYE